MLHIIIITLHEEFFLMNSKLLLQKMQYISLTRKVIIDYWDFDNISAHCKHICTQLLRIWLHFPKKLLMEDFIFSPVYMIEKYYFFTFYIFLLYFVLLPHR